MPILSALLVCFISISHPIPSSAESRSLPLTCTYETQIWNVNLKSSVGRKQVRHSYNKIISEEIDTATGCTVCSEDQVSISIPPLPVFSVCYKIAPRVHDMLYRLIRSGAPISEVVGYHVLKSRGPVDGNGNRTGFSNHSFGTAIDINPEMNGLYDNCVTFGPQCRLIRGGEWRPGTPGTLNKDDDVVTLFRQAGFQWGGEITGKQKDFMHFSLTGY